MDKKQYKSFMSCTRKVMRDNILKKMQALSDEFYLSDEDMAKMEQLSGNITVFCEKFYGREVSLSERRTFIEMYRR